jgi:tetratricopeptide (TPR) repeat protein
MKFAAVAAAVLMFAATGASAADGTEPAGPPLSAAPLRLPPVQLPPVAPRAADADAATYERCIKLAGENPQAAHELAAQWRQRGGAHPADHCLAVALIGLKQYKEAAERLEKLAPAMVHAPAPLRAEVLGQAAQAWLLAGEPGRAYAADGAALALLPDDPDLLTDRAEAAGSAGWYDKAIADLDRVLQSHPTRAEALIYRASAYRRQGRLDPAWADIEAALKASPESVPALLERGNIRILRGDLDGARQDWRRVAALSPGSAAGGAAKANIARLDALGDAADKRTGQR